MHGYWQLWEQGLSKEQCEVLISQASELPVEEATIGFDEHNRTDDSYRRSKIRWIPRADQGWAGLYNVVESYIHTANNNAFGFDITRVAELQFTEYDADDEGMYDWHEDLNWLSNSFSHRKLSLVINLSDPSLYEGGNLELAPPEFEAPNVDVLRTQGSVVVFPSFVKHRVTPVTKGKRYSLVAWMEGPKFR